MVDPYHNKLTEAKTAATTLVGGSNSNSNKCKIKISRSGSSSDSSSSSGSGSKKRNILALIGCLFLTVFNLYHFYRQNNVLVFLTTTQSQSQSQSQLETLQDNQKSQQNRNGQGQCVSIDTELKDIISKTKNVMIVMAAKSSGITHEVFVHECYGDAIPEDRKNKDWHWRLWDHSENLLLTKFYEFPNVVSTHLHNGDKDAISLFKNTDPKETLIVYVHREETDRLLSAIRQVTDAHCRLSQLNKEELKKNLRNDEAIKLFKINSDGSCTINEQDLVQGIIKKRKYEIGLGASDILTCGFYEAIQDNAPNILYMDYKQTNELHKILADKYCPTLQLPIHINSGSGKKTVFVKLQNATDDNNNGDDIIVPLDDWTNVKRNHLEWTLRLKETVSCQAKTRQMENQLFESCDDHFWRPPSSILL